MDKQCKSKHSRTVARYKNKEKPRWPKKSKVDFNLIKYHGGNKNTSMILRIVA